MIENQVRVPPFVTPIQHSRGFLENVIRQDLRACLEVLVGVGEDTAAHIPLTEDQSSSSREGRL